MNRKN